MSGYFITAKTNKQTKTIFFFLFILETVFNKCAWAIDSAAAKDVTEKKAKAPSLEGREDRYLTSLSKREEARRA